MKHATKEMAEEAREFLQKKVFGQLPTWVKSIDVEYDDHGWFVTTRIKNRQEYTASNVEIPSIIDVNGFKLKNCIMVLG